MHNRKWDLMAAMFCWAGWKPVGVWLYQLLRAVRQPANASLPPQAQQEIIRTRIQSLSMNLEATPRDNSPLSVSLQASKLLIKVWSSHCHALPHYAVLVQHLQPREIRIELLLWVHRANTIKKDAKLTDSLIINKITSKTKETQLLTN